MLHDARSGTATSRRGLARAAGIWEVVGILAAVIPCGILAGLYLATRDAGFLVACIALVALAVGIVFMRSPRILSRRPAVSPRLREAGEAIGRVFTLRIMKVLGFAAWILAWGVTAAFYARVVNNPNIGMLVTLVLVGGFSPVVIYFSLESGVKKLSGRMRDRK